MHTILIVDDESEIRSSLQGVLEDEGYKTVLAESGEECLTTLGRKPIDVILLDIWLPGIDGLEALERIVEMDDPPEVIMISGHGNIETAVRATKLGAFDFLEKPLSIERTLIVLKNAIHAKRLRKDEMFVEVNCAAIPEDLIESELFGHRVGSFPGASSDKEGKFQKADGGTLFLDEVGDMSLKTQSKVLRTLDEGRFVPVGEEEPITADARVIAATNKDLEDEISKGNFREDLFYRLNVIPFYVPPLRERKEDIAQLARHFLKEFSHTYNRRPREIADDALETLTRYTWPGNVRELRNLIERIVIMNPAVARLERKHLPTLVYREGGRRSLGEFSSLHEARESYERDYILKKLDENLGNVSRTAEVLGLERSHMYRKMKALGIAVKE